MTTSYVPRFCLPGLEQALAAPGFGLVADAAWRTFTAQAGPVSPGDPFYLLWATLDFAARPSLAERLLDGPLPPALRQGLAPLLDSAMRVFAVEPAGRGRHLVDVLDGTPWRSALAALAPTGSLVYTRLAGAPTAPWPAGPVVVFPRAARDVLCSWLLDRFARARAGGADALAFYRQVGPALYRWWRVQREASIHARVV